MYLGIDLGTSSVKVILWTPEEGVIQQDCQPLTVQRPHPLWSEQDPLQWWQALDSTMLALKSRGALGMVKAIGLSGQMHGATLLDAEGEVIRPAILWNDGRSAVQCEELEQQVPQARQITGNMVMPGFTAPKLRWLWQQEPESFRRVHKVLLPKDYLRFRLTGEFASDMSDSAGTAWMDTASRSWNKAMLEACGLSEAAMPELFEGNQITGYLSASLAQRWGMKTVPVAAGGGDNAAGAIGVGLTEPGQAMLSLGTSGVYFAVSDGFKANTDDAVHSFCHALPDRWHLMSVMLSAASCLSWLQQISGADSVAHLLAEMEATPASQTTPLFLPYLSGERTPHNDPNAAGVFFGLRHDTRRADMTRAVLEGIGYGLADGAEALHKTGLEPSQINLIGGGVRNAYWRQLLADQIGKPMVYRKGGDVGPALGAARLACLAMNPDTPISDICPQPLSLSLHQPDQAEYQRHQERRSRFNRLYHQLENLF
ncbi:xylulokinase [Ferrimonas marina]|uniref:Xylulose kinase n=1 Tax=Ferrimonas marina TaxID=299255 RepID=A0A1M5NDM4_9GAMM|nr:xylulokinase [Ferrimonas marina]SHG87555.1 xylulokinase [Ferrimonas marina]